MDNWYVIAAIWIIGALISAIRAANKKKAVAAKPQTNQNPQSNLPNVFHNPAPIQSPATPKQPQSGSLAEELKKQREQDWAQVGHFSEERLVEEFESLHKMGKQLPHHFHQPLKALPSVYKDRKKPVNHPLGKFLRNKENVKMAMVVHEVLKRPEF